MDQLDKPQENFVLEKKFVMDKKISIQGILGVLTILGGLFVFGTGWEHRMTVVEAASASTATAVQVEVLDRKAHDDKVDAERQAIWQTIREMNTTLKELNGKLK